MILAVITTRHLHNYTKKIVEEMKLECDIRYFVYSNFTNLIDIYAHNYNYVDGFLISSILSSQWLVRTYPICKKPVVSFNTDMASLYKTLLQLINTDRDIDFSRIYLDIIQAPLTKGHLEKLLSYSQPAYELQNLIKQIETLNLDGILEVYNHIVEQMKEEWAQGNMDMAVVTFSNIVDEMESCGIRYSFSYPSVDHIQESVHQLIKDIQLHKMSENQPAVIQITINDYHPELQEFNKNNELLPILLQEALTIFNKNNLTNFLVKRNIYGFEVYTSQKTIERITAERTNCSLSRHLEKALQFPVSIGYGYGKDIAEARKRAVKASQEAHYRHITCGFLLTAEDQMIGPLSSGSALTVSRTNTEYYNKVSQKTGISQVNIQKILAIMRILRTERLTAADIATHLSITLRSANRFLAKLTEAGEAEIIGEEQSSSRGRPKKIYQILLKEEDMLK